jgi:hypothetical protein
MNKMKFKKFLINENKSILSQRIGDILNAIQDLSDDPKNIDKKQKVENIVNQIRRILHTKWPSSQENSLLVLRKCAANLMMSIDPKKENRPDLDLIINGCKKGLESLIKNLEAPINQIITNDQ